MSWPVSQDYNEAIQNPRSSFSDAELREGHVTVHALGLPLPRSGNFADVYEFHCPKHNTRWALKCFTRKVAGLRERYSEISRCLQEARLPFTVAFQYLEQGIRIRGQWYPILKMRWVEGHLLNEFVRDNLDKPSLVQSLGLIWQRMAKRLREVSIAHADLQHGNVLLVPGATAQSLGVRLIDYDGMFVPSLAGKKSGEVGHPNYQHPQRLREGTYNAEVDRVPLLVVATALRALSVGGRELWERHDNGDNLLFKESDLRSPAESELFHELKEMRDPLVKSLAGRLAEACELRLEDAPLLEELLPEEKPAAKVAARPAGAITATAPVEEVEEAPNWDFGQDEEEPRPRKKPKRRKARRKQSKVPVWAWAGGGAVALLLLLVGIVVATRNGGEKSNGPTAADGRAEVPSKDGGKKPPEGDVTSGGIRGDRILPGLQGGASYAVFSGDSKWAVFRGSAGLHLWDMVKLQSVAVWPGFSNTSLFMALSRGGDKLLCLKKSSLFDHTLQLVDLKTGKILRDCEKNRSIFVEAVAISPDGNRGALGGWIVPGGPPNTNELSISNLETGKRVAAWKGHTADILSLSFSPDGSKLLSLGKDGLRVWEASRGKELAFWPLPSQHGQLSPDSRQVVTTADDIHFAVWDVKTHKELGRFTSPATGQAFEFAGDGRVALCYPVSRGKNKEPADPAQCVIRVFDARAGKEVSTLKGHTDLVFRMFGSPDGRRLLSLSSDRTVRLWDLARMPPPSSQPTRPGAQEVSGGRPPSVPNGVTGMTFSLERRRLLVSDFTKAVSVWDLERGKKEYTVTQMDGVQGQRMALLADGRRMLCLPQNGALQLVDVATGKVERRFEPGVGGVNVVRLSPDGRLALTGGGVPSFGGGFGLCELSLWELDKDKRLNVWKGHTQPVYDARFNADSSRAVTCGGDGIRVWEVSSGKMLNHVATPAMKAACISPDCRFVATLKDETVTLWDVPAGSKLRNLSVPKGQVHSLAFTNRGDRLAAGCGGNLPAQPGMPARPDPAQCVIWLWDVSTGQELGCFKANPTPVLNLAISPDDGLLVSSGLSSTFQQWYLSEKVLPEKPVPEGPLSAALAQLSHPRWVASLAVSSDSRQLLAGDTTGKVVVWDLKTHRKLRSLNLSVFLRRMVFLPGNRRILCATSSDVLQEVDATTGAVVRRLGSASHTARFITLSASGHLALMAGAQSEGRDGLSVPLDCKIYLWDVKSGKLRASWDGHTGAVVDACFTPDDRQIVSLGLDGIRVWEVANGKPLNYIPAAKGSWQARLSPDGRQAALPSGTGPIRIWDVASATELKQLPARKGAVLTVAFAVRGDRLLVGQEAAAPAGGATEMPAPCLRLWDLKTGQELRRFQGHTKFLQDVAVTPNDLLGISCAHDNTVRLWDLNGMGQPK